MKIDIDAAADWHGGERSYLTNIARRIVDALGRPIRIPVVPWPNAVWITNGSAPPMTVPSNDGVAKIRVALDDRYWIQFIYQLGHEFGHVLSNHWTFYRPGPFHWLEEAICGSLSLAALHEAQMNSKLNLQALRSDVASYISNTLETSAPLSRGEVPGWYSLNNDALRRLQKLDQENARLSSVLCDTIRSRPILVRSLPARNRWCDVADATLGSHLGRWIEECKLHGISPDFPEELANLFGVAPQ